MIMGAVLLGNFLPFDYGDLKRLIDYTSKVCPSDTVKESFVAVAELYTTYSQVPEHIFGSQETCVVREFITTTY